ncbi:MAG: sulfite exporter TauE/SafE family protein [Acidimicrobiia bacterium]|nr:sulfite exporter TauE/SafE family protein [Acidimicrobiia bacterium]
MTLLEAAAIVAAGTAAGGVNAVIGSGGLITFPTLVALGYPPITANVSNNIGLVPGSISGTFGYRRELRGQGGRARTLATGSGLGGLTGAILLLNLPSDVFDAVVPILVLAACALMVAQPRLTTWVTSRRDDDARDVGVAPVAIAFLAGIYGGYFGAAQGVILLAMLAVFVPDEIQRSNALKNVLAGTVNTVAAILFILFADVAWEAVALVGLGAIVGGALGARVGRRIPAVVLRTLVVLLGMGVAIRFALT